MGWTGEWLKHGMVPRMKCGEKDSRSACVLAEDGGLGYGAVGKIESKTT